MNQNSARSVSNTITSFCFYLFLMYRCLSIICVSLCTLGPGENVVSPATGLIDAFKPPCGFWESNPRFPEEHAVLLTVEAFLQSQNKSFYNCMVY